MIHFVKNISQNYLIIIVYYLFSMIINVIVVVNSLFNKVLLFFSIKQNSIKLVY